MILMTYRYPGDGVDLTRKLKRDLQHVTSDRALTLRHEVDAEPAYDAGGTATGQADRPAPCRARDRGYLCAYQRVRRTDGVSAVVEGRDAHTSERVVVGGPALVFARGAGDHHQR